MTRTSRSPKTAEASFNDTLSKVLRTRHPRWSEKKVIGAEQTNVFSEGAGLKPDIVIRHPGGIPVVVETEYVPAISVESDAISRMGRTLKDERRRIEQSVALRIPKDFKKKDQYLLEKLIPQAKFEFCVFSGDPKNPDRWPERGYFEGGVNDLASCIELAAMSEDRIVKDLDILEEGISQTACLLRSELVDKPAALEKIAKKLHQQDGDQTTRMGMAIVANALTFHTAITGVQSKDGSFVINSLSELHNPSSGILPKEELMRHWREILTRINYWPIFSIASEILTPIPVKTAQKVLAHLLDMVWRLVELGTASQHDISGRMFQRLISDRKFLATFYTLPNSAALLAEIAVDRLDIQEQSEDAICSLRIGDFACGTGALLNATYQAALSRFRRQGGDDRKIHSRMMESALVGADIMPAATHLTASLLSGVHPTVPFSNTRIVTLPYGQPREGSGQGLALGALDLIKEESTLPLFGTGQERLRGLATDEHDDNETISPNETSLPHGDFDLVVMNPPFTRPTNHETANVPVPSFAGFSTSADEQKAMSAKLKRIRRPGMAGSGHAGLASNFMDIAHAKLKSSGGVLALVLPASFLQGASWEAARRMLEKHYTDIAIISISAQGMTAQSFSADTGMAEVLVIATRKENNRTSQKTRKKDKDVFSQPCFFVNLASRPRSILEATMTARALRRISTNSKTKAGEIFADKSKSCRLGCYIRSTLAETGSAGLRSYKLAQIASALTQGELRLPRRSTKPVPIPVCRLGDLGKRGLVHREINGGLMGGKLAPFDIVRLYPLPPYLEFPALWSHSAERETRMIIEPDSYGTPREGLDSEAEKAWESTASRLHFNLDFRINSQPLAACMTPDLTLGGTAWPNFLCKEKHWEIPLVLMSNTTLGLIAFWWIGSRQQQGRARLTISRLPNLTVLDPRKLDAAQMEFAGRLWDDFKGRDLLPANEAYRDDTRKDLDRAVLADMLRLPPDIMGPLDLLRRQWCAEPSVHGGKSTALQTIS